MKVQRTSPESNAIMERIQHEDGTPLTLEEWEDKFGYNPMDVNEVYYNDHPRVGDANVAGRLYSVREGDGDSSEWTVEQGWHLVNILHRFIISDEIEEARHRK